MRAAGLVVVGTVLACTFAGCIKRTAAPPGAVSPTAPGSPSGPSAEEREAASAKALAAANERIADKPHVDLVGPAGIAAFAPQGEVKKIEVAPFAAVGQPFTDAARVTVKEAGGHAWAVQIVAKNAAPVAMGDSILATFFLRTETPQEGSVGETEFVFELARSPYTKSVSYPVQGVDRWAKIQVKFQSEGNFAAGEAQMIFRLGYEPETLEIGGVRVENFGKLALGELPSTQGSDRRRERAAAAALKAAEAKAVAVEGGELRFEVTPSKVIRAISPYVYGINSQKAPHGGATVRRMGGNRQSAYNWEIDGSSAGSDYEHSSDSWACTAMGYTTCGQPAAQFIEFAKQNHGLGMESIVTIPMVDFVVADKLGAVLEKDKAPSKRWVKSLPKKPGAFAAAPDLADGVVYEDEFVHYLVGKAGKAGGGGARFYSLDNEPALWPSTHPRVHPAKTRYDEMVTRTEATAAGIVKEDADAVVLGAVMFGWSEFMSLSEAPDFKAHNDKYGTYVDFMLAAFKQMEAKHGKRLVHALDVHWYPEARGTKRITEKDTSGKTITARLQATRSLWDPNYTEKSWITAQSGKAIRLIPWLLERIAARYPGTKLAMTEYNFGAGEHISGGLAQIDVLGIFGREGLSLGNYWGDGPGNGDLPPYILAAFKMFRGYDGKGGAFGDTAVTATTDLDKASIFAATDSKKPGVLTVIAVNKELRTSHEGRIDIKDGGFTKAHVFTLDGTSPELKPQADVEIKAGRISYKLPPLSAALFVCEK